jgi:hypothetical protein
LIASKASPSRKLANPTCSLFAMTMTVSNVEVTNKHMTLPLLSFGFDHCHQQQTAEKVTNRQEVSKVLKHASELPL